MIEYDIEYNVNLKKYNSYGIGGSAKYLIRPRYIEELQKLLNFLKKENIPFYILGGGTNVVLPDEDFDGAIIKLDHLDTFYLSEDYVYAASGLSLSLFIKKLIDNNYVNLAPLYGIPGTLGGALVGNAGSFGKSLYEDVLNVLILEDDEIKLVKKENIKYSYRHTEFKNSNKIILGASFKLEKGDKEESLRQIKENLKFRNEKQPLEYKNAGSVFKNPEGLSAGKIIEDCNLKGYNVNDAYVSNKHANFFINVKNATGSDIRKLIEDVKKKVKDEKNIDLEMEQIIIKW